MKTGNDVIRQAMMLLGYTNSYGEVDSGQDAPIVKSAPAAVQQIFNDLYPIEHPGSDAATLKMTDELPLSSGTVNDIMPYGVAMLIALFANDGNKQAAFAAFYNQKRPSVPRAAMTRTDVLPNVSGAQDE